MIISSVTRTNTAAWILSLATEPATAVQIAHELEERAHLRPAQFWFSVVRSTVLTAVEQIRRAPWSVASLTIVAYVSSGLLAYVLVILPEIALQRGYESPLLSAWWVRDFARACTSPAGAWVGRELAGPLLLGIIVAGFARRRELTALIAILISQILAGMAAQAYAGSSGAGDFSALLVYVPRNYLPAFLGIVLVRCWRLSADSHHCRPSYTTFGR